MFRHHGKSRTFKHNLQIATVLSFVAGILNVTGFLAFQELTTNVTGHFALFIYDVFNIKFWKGTIYFLYIFSFLLGSFVSSVLIIKFRGNKKINIFVVPTVLEALILIGIAVSSNYFEINSPNVIICLLLFAMGLQNSFVTKISNAIVRTTHLTGLFTDLGIDLSRLLFPKLYPQRKKLKANIKLRLYIISFFFLGGIIGGVLYSKARLKLNTLSVAAAILIISLFYDHFKHQLIKTKRKYNSIKKSCNVSQKF